MIQGSITPNTRHNLRRPAATRSLARETTQHQTNAVGEANDCRFKTDPSRNLVTSSNKEVCTTTSPARLVASTVDSIATVSDACRRLMPQSVTAASRWQPADWRALASSCCRLTNRILVDSCRSTCARIRKKVIPIRHPRRQVSASLETASRHQTGQRDRQADRSALTATRREVRTSARFQADSALGARLSG